MTKSKSEMIFIPLGGTGEIGMNLNLYGYEGKWLMVDLGVTFGETSSRGFEIIMPDPSFIIERKDDLVGIVLTHAHEDHIGAVPYLWAELRCPIYATPFTAALVRHKLYDAGIHKEAILHEIPVGGTIDLNPFRVKYVTLTHSIPEPNAVLIETDAGRVLHTGDWKFDPAPLVGDDVDRNALAELGQLGIDALVCDSTNAMEKGRSGSEGEVRESLLKLVQNYPDGRLAIACFASNIARLETIAIAAKSIGRRVGLVGRSLWRMNEIARDLGYLKDLDPFLSEQEAALMARNKILLICTGSQGEPMAALTRISNGTHPHIKLQAGDSVVYSSRMIPGNEKAIFAVQNNLVKMGVELLTAKDEFTHVSGHPSQDELTQMYQWVKPRCVIPVHGEARHLLAQGRHAKACQVPEVIVTENGAVIRIGPDYSEIIDTVPVGRWAMDGKTLTPLTKPLLRMRERVFSNGFLAVTIALDIKGLLRGDPQLSSFGVWDYDPEDEEWWNACELVREIIAGLTPVERRNDNVIMEIIEAAFRKHTRNVFGKKPLIEVNVIRV
jgi:ribonuclease J